MVHLNIRSLVNKYEQLKLELVNSGIDIFSTSETWLSNGVHSNLIQIPGYNVIRLDRSFCDVDTGLLKRGGGLAIYYVDTLSCDSKKWAHFNQWTQHIEVQVVEFIREKARNIIFVNVYGPPNGVVEGMTGCLSRIITNIPRLDCKDLVLMGDFNVDLLINNPDVRRLTRFRELNSLLQLIDVPTRVTPTTSSLLDLILCKVTHVKNSGVLDIFLSDHQPVYLVKKMDTSPNNRKQKINFTGRTYRHYKTELMQDNVDRSINVNYLMELDDPVLCWNALYQSLNLIADKIIPEKTYLVKKDILVWLTPELLNLKKDRDYFFKKAKITGDDADWFIARNLRNRTNIAMRSAKAEYIKNKLTENSDNPKKFWNIINKEILPKNNKTIFNFVNTQTETLYKQEEVPNLINNYFSDIGPKLASEIPIPTNGTSIVGDPNNNNFELLEFTSPDLLQLIRNISIHKSSGLKNLSTRFFKDVMLYIPHVFLHLYNIVRLSGIFPDT